MKQCISDLFELHLCITVMQEVDGQLARHSHVIVFRDTEGRATFTLVADEDGGETVPLALGGDLGTFSIAALEGVAAVGNMVLREHLGLFGRRRRGREATK